MIAGVNRIWIIDHRLVLSKGYRINNNRIGLSVNAVGFEELTIARNTAEYECQKENNTWEHKVIVKGYSDVAADLSNAQKRMNKRYVVAMYLNSGEMIIAGIDTPLRISVKNTSGAAPGEAAGYTLTFGSTSRNSFEFIDKTMFIPAILNIKNGLLYNWYAAIDVRNITNEGWRLPTNNDFIELVAYCNNEYTKVLDKNLQFWGGVDYGQTNEYKLNLRGSGRVDIYHSRFEGLFTDFLIMSPENLYPEIEGYIYLPFLRFDSDYLYFEVIGDTPRYLGSLRPIKETTSLSHGQEGSYIGNDGRIYKTICIGNQEWVADNLAETLYRNKEQIPERTSNWQGLTTGAYCAYNNDHANI